MLDWDCSPAKYLHFLDVDAIHLLRRRYYAFIDGSIWSTGVDKIRLLVSKERSEVKLPQIFANIQWSFTSCFILQSAW